ncbi:MAG: site-specific integrase [Clostridiales bacterium]|nr:site-specific integrase [Clostridiales bacterium]
MARKSIKRANGSGSVYRRAGAHAKPWVAVSPSRYQEGTDGVVRAVRQQLGSYATKAEARAALEQFNQAPTDKYNLTVGDAWRVFIRKVEQSKSASTVAAYSAAWKKCSYMENWPLRTLRTDSMQEVIDNNREMSASTLNNIKIVLTAICDYGEKNDILRRNYAKFIELPRKERAIRDAFTELEVEKLRQAVDTVPFADVVYFMCWTGWRVGEVVQFRQQDFDRDAWTLTGGVKTAAGKNRTVPIPKPVRPIVERWADRGCTYIFADPATGRQMSTGTFRQKYFAPCCRAVGIRELTPHATRRTAETMAAKSGMRPELMLAIFGHTDYKTDVQHYIRPTVETISDAMEKMG